MKSEGTAKWVRQLMWFNVMLCGWPIYHGYQKVRRCAIAIANTDPRHRKPPTIRHE